MDLNAEFAKVKRIPQFPLTQLATGLDSSPHTLHSFLPFFFLIAPRVFAAILCTIVGMQNVQSQERYARKKPATNLWTGNNKENGIS